VAARGLLRFEDSSAHLVRCRDGDDAGRNRHRDSADVAADELALTGMQSSADLQAKQAPRMPRAAPSKVASRPSPAVLISWPRNAVNSFRKTAYAELQGILWDLRQRPAHEESDREHQDKGQESAQSAGQSRPRSAPVAMTMNTTSKPSRTTALNAVTPAIPSRWVLLRGSACRRSAVVAAKAAASS
jgi:hypothetical protein